MSENLTLPQKQLEILEELIDKRVEQSVQVKKEAKSENFVQLFREGMTPFRKLMRENMNAAQLFYFLLENMDYGNSLTCSSTVFEEVLGKSRSTITRSIRDLKDRGFIAVSKMGTTNVYHVNAKVAWSSWPNGKRYAKLNATVVLAESEQTSPTQVELLKTAKTVKTVFQEE